MLGNMNWISKAVEMKFTKNKLKVRWQILTNLFFKMIYSINYNIYTEIVDAQERSVANLLSQIRQTENEVGL